MTGSEERLVAENIQGWTVGHHLPLVQDDGARAQFEDHIEIMTGDDAGMMKVLQQAYQLPTVAVHMVPPTAGERRASAMCMQKIFLLYGMSRAATQKEVMIATGFSAPSLGIIQSASWVAANPHHPARGIA